MEPRQYINLIKRWSWILVLGILLGVGIGYAISLYQEPIYQASTKVLIQQAPETAGLGVGEDALQLGTTFTELLTTRPVIQEASKQLGYGISSGQVRVQRVTGSQLIQLTVEDEEPDRAAEIANTLVRVFLEQNETLQSSRFSASEESLQAQMQQVQEQISDFQLQLTEQNTQTLDEQLNNLTKTIADLQTEIRSLQEEVIRLQYSGEPVQGRSESGRLVMMTPTPSVEQRIEIATKGDRLNQLQSLLNQYQSIYVSLSNSRAGGGATSKSEQIQAALALYQQIYSNLLNNYEAIRLARLKSTPNILQVEEALPPRSPVRPKPMNNMAIGGILGLLLAGGIAFTVEYMDDTLRSPTDVVRVLQLPVLGYIGEIQHKGLRKPGSTEVLPLVLEQPRSPVAEAFRSLRTNLEFIDTQNELHTLLITSPGHSEGKSTVATNLAIVMAQAGKRVILVDADLRRPNVHNQLGISNRVGLSDVLQGRVTLPSVEKAWKEDNLVVITSGRLPVNPAELLSSARMLNVLQDLRNRADYVIIDGPPFALSDALIMGAKVDGVLVVIQPNRSVANAAVTMLDQLERAGANVIGVALNRIHRNDSSYYYKALKDYNSYSYDN